MSLPPLPLLPSHVDCIASLPYAFLARTVPPSPNTAQDPLSATLQSRCHHWHSFSQGSETVSPGLCASAAQPLLVTQPPARSLQPLPWKHFTGCRDKLRPFTEKGEFLPLKEPNGGRESAGKVRGHGMHSLHQVPAFLDTWGDTTSNTSTQPNFFPSLGQGIWGPTAVLTGTLPLQTDRDNAIECRRATSVLFSEQALHALG